VLEAAAWAGLGASSLILGAFLALHFEISSVHIGEAMGFGAGALIAALAYELIPNENVSDVWVWICFGAGAVVFYVSDMLLERSARGETGGQTIALGALLDGVPESLVLGMSLALGGSVSFGFLVAVFVSNVPEGLSATSDMAATRRASLIYRLWIGIAVISAVAGAIGFVAVENIPGNDGRYVQAFAAGAVLTMLADGMMPEAFERGRKRVALLTALGFAVAAVLTTLE
jgi:ZIP family zinc transporter